MTHKVPGYRTPDERFAGLEGFDFDPHYLQGEGAVKGLRMHYLDEGPRESSQTFLCLHGQPSWCYLYRKMIPVFVDAGARVVAPDFYGFGRSDKPLDDDSYTFTFHRDSLLALINALDLQNITLVCQDWGGLLGLTLPMDLPGRFSRLLVMNTALATGTSPPSEGFLAWKAWSATQHNLDVGKLMRRAIPGLSDGACKAYNAPFEGPESKAGVRRFPQIVPVSPEMDGAALSQRAVGWWRSEWSGQSFMAIGMQDPVLGPPVMRRLQRVIRGCPEPLEIADGGHFVQEQGDRIARAALEVWA